MAAQQIDYIELYTADGKSTFDYFASALAFTPVAESWNAGSHSVLLRQGGAQLIITSGAITRDFLEAHGDGIADIAFACDDVASSRDRAVAAGASLIASSPSPAVTGGFGDVRHTLVARSTGHSLPAGRAWTEVPAAGPAASPISDLDHVAVCVTGGSLTDCADFYTNGFGLARYSSEYTEIGDQAMESIVVRSPSGGITFTILEQDATKKAGQIEAFLSRNGGQGVQHLAFAVDDIITAVHESRDRGVEFLRTPGAYYDMLASRLPDIQSNIASLRTVDVLADCDEWGYLLQLFTRSPYRRNTLFYEFIQRRGARGFGSANIKALYEAVERDELGAG
jgi:4-hydroxymandelate synthase